MSDETHATSLSTGAQMPLLGLGTWLSKDADKLCAAVHQAIDVGYRMFDTAFLYQTEASLGAALQRCFEAGKIRRDQIFITTKDARSTNPIQLPFTAHAPEDIEIVVAQQLRTLQVDYIDLYLIHCPCAVKHREGSFAPLISDGRFVVDDSDITQTWKVLEKLHKQQKLRAIGVSNFNIDQIEQLCRTAEVKPHNLQLELHAYFKQHELHDYCKSHGITVTAYAPLGSPGRKEFNPGGFWPDGEPLKDPTIHMIAKECNKTPAKILLRYIVQRGISAVPKSVTLDHIRENIDIFDFKLTSEQMARIESIGQSVRLFVFDYLAHHPCYPMLDQDRAISSRVSFDSF